MIPLRLKLSGFLSYRHPVELDFSGFHLACISGENGAGKSSLLDAMTWALFGQARKRDESVVNLQSKAAEVAFSFSYESNQYRVIRSQARGKTQLLEFQVLDGSEWRPLTEHTKSETQARIEKVLRLDYDTFINVSFFLQGRADQFAQQIPTRRKEILGNILGLEIWETYKARAAAQRKTVEDSLAGVDGRISDIEAELAEEEPRKINLAQLQAKLDDLSALRKAQETSLESIKLVRAGLDKQRELVQRMGGSLENLSGNLSGLRSRLAGRETERQPHAELMQRASEIEVGYIAWKKARQKLEKWDGAASQFHEQEKRRSPFLDEINAEKAKLEQEQETLEEQGRVASGQSAVLGNITQELVSAREALSKAETNLAHRLKLEEQIQLGQVRLGELRVENTGLKNEMDEIKLRMEKLQAAEGATCPLCGQPLSPGHRKSTLGQLQAEGDQKGDAWRTNKSAAEELADQVGDQKKQVTDLAGADADRLNFSGSIAQLSERLDTLKKQTKEWEAVGSKRLVKVNKLIEGEKYAAEARKSLAVVDKELAALGYDAAAHDTARKIEIQSRPAEEEYRLLEAARAALKPLDNEIANLNSQVTSLAAQMAIQQNDYDSAVNTLKGLEAQAPDQEGAEASLINLQERENLLNQEVGAARQKVNVLDDLRKRKKKLEMERSELGIQVGRYKALERAFGRDGVPALLIEQALPEIEIKANEILGRLSDDSMHLHFETQAKYKDEKRKDLRETLEIQVSDGAGERDYEMFSGGEAFRVNFAIRLALSEVLAQRKGARLQMLVIDEGFGSQDAQGRQRLIQSINAVQADFAKILVITHLDELKDAFPTRIEVDKTEKGSTIKVI